MSIRAARTQAEALINELKIVRAPVDVHYIAKHLNLRIVEYDLGGDVSGLLITGQNSSTIAVQEDQPIKRKRFTIAHEIAHHRLGHQFGDEHVHVDRGYVVTPRNSRSSKGVEPKEVEANQFAASLLMPTALIEAKIKSENMLPLHDQHIVELAEIFEVSEQAMTIRLSSLGYL